MNFVFSIFQFLSTSDGMFRLAVLEVGFGGEEPGETRRAGALFGLLFDPANGGWFLDMFWFGLAMDTPT